jgi:hypothetical protein
MLPFGINELSHFQAEDPLYGQKTRNLNVSSFSHSSLPLVGTNWSVYLIAAGGVS